jgi:hypothetical protein
MEAEISKAMRPDAAAPMRKRALSRNNENNVLYFHVVSVHLQLKLYIKIVRPLLA